MAITYITGQFQSFRATIDFTIGLENGNAGTQALQVHKDAVYEFDGVTFRLPGGESYAVPRVKGAIAGSWLVPVGDVTTTYTPKPAGVQMHEARSVSETRKPVAVEITTNDDHKAGSIAETNARRAQAQGKPLSEAERLALAEAENRERIARITDSVRNQPTGSMATVGGNLVSGSGRTNGVDASQRGKIAFAGTGENGFGEVTMSKPIHTMVPEVMVGSEGSRTRATGVSLDTNPSLIDSRVPPRQVEEREIALAEEKQFLESGVVDAVARYPLQKKAAVDPVGPKVDPVAEVVSTWDKNRHWKKRVKEALDFYAGNATLLEAICAIEDPGVVKEIRSSLK